MKTNNSGRRGGEGGRGGGGGAIIRGRRLIEEILYLDIIPETQGPSKELKLSAKVNSRPYF